MTISLNTQYNLYVPSYEPRLLTHNWFEKNYTNVLRDTQAAITHAQKHRTCIQAGGFLGIWPKHLSKFFTQIYTFEPNPVICECLVKNCGEIPNIFIANAALGPHMGKVKLNQAKAGADSCNPHMNGYSKSYFVDMVNIDSLGLNDLDVIFLDVERFEIEALRGGHKTIQKCKPVIQVEMHDKIKTELHAYLESIGYKQIDKAGSRDYVYVPI